MAQKLQLTSPLLFGENEFSLFCSAQPIELPFVFDPDFVAAAAQVSKTNDLGEPIR